MKRISAKDIKESTKKTSNMENFVHQILLLEAGSWWKIEKPFLFFNDACKLASAYADKHGEDRIKIESFIQQ